ncbi:MAG: nucleoside deaminase [Candidatus Paraimprobicoccus trichonymphae]|uniref:Nucleoside deaminase n=1 Tax=Candidatus Paraimprobicoccus trichonymphae TaxID=3033793 RepID=A0AA48I0A6_9FIRM|nr:MAG: nucleoside deaminase [Candidatus Paraimprobicoccus trichonymphae]
MQIALNQAKLAKKNLDIPVGAVIVTDNEVISKGYNKKEKFKNAIYHAEIEAIFKANRILKNWRLTNCELYVTLEPCIMCAGAVINSRISKLIYGSKNLNSNLNIFEIFKDYKIEIIPEILEKECFEILKFSNIFNKNT